MVKRVFKIIAIVLGCATALVGAVAGIMALRGEFKTPIVPPAELIFMESEQEVIDTGNADDIFSFTLTGLSNQEHEVNQKDCKLWFVEGGDLITLCGANGEPLTSVQNKYMVKCNEPIYYKINAASSEMLQGGTFGKVVLRAWDAKDQVPSNNLTIWIDREIKSIKLNHSAEVISKVQTLELGVDVRQYFEYTTSPEYAINPFSREEAKVVETYVLTSSDGYIPLQEAYLRDDCKDFIHKEASSGKFYFESAVSRSTPFQFKIAVFKTYKDKREYEASDQALTNSNSERINTMVNISLNINVVNSEVSSVGFNSTGVALNLFSNNNYLTLNSSSGVTGANNNNLKLFMIRDGKTTEIRFNEVDFLLKNEDVWLTGAEFAKFIGEDVDEASKFNLNSITIEEINTENKTITTKADALTGTQSVTYSYALGDVKYGNKTLISSLSHTTEGENPITTTYYCSSGLAFLEEDATDGATICTLNPGSYLDFYIYNEAESIYTQVADKFDYSINSVSGNGSEKSFNVIAKNIPELEEGNSLVLGVLVSNGTGGKTPLFASLPVTVTEVDLDFSFVNGTDRVLNIDYEQTTTEPGELVEYKTVYGELALTDIITINKGSHSTCLFVTPKEADENNYNIKVLPNATLTIAGNSYVVVGYFDENNRFVNAVSPKEETETEETATSLGAVHNSTTNLYVVQLLTGYDKDGNLKTTEDIITNAVEMAQNVQPTEGGEGNPGQAEPLPSTSIFNTTLTLGSLEDKPTDATGYVVIGDNFINGQNLIFLKIKYAYYSEAISFEFETPEDGADLQIKIDANKVVALEKSGTFNVVLKSSIPNMLRNLFVDAEDFKTKYLSVDFYEDENTKISGSLNNVEIGTPILEPESGNVIIPFNTNERFANNTYFARISIKYENLEAISTLPIYVQDSTPQDIIYVFDETPEELGDSKTFITLAEDEASANNDENYIKIVKSYDEGTIKDLIKLVVAGREYVIAETFEGVFNQAATSQKVDNGQYANGFIPVRRDFDIKTELITYSCRDSKVLNLINSSTSVGSTVLSVTADGKVTRYIKVQVVGEGFNLTSNFNPELSAETDTLNLSQPQSSTETAPMVKYTYTDVTTGAETNLSTGLLNIDLENITVLKFGAGETCEVVPANGENASDGYLIRTIQTTKTILRMQVVDNNWVLTRENFKHAELQLSLVLTAPTTTETVTLIITFASNIEYAINQNWEVVRAGTTALVYECRNNKSTAFANESIVRVTNTTDGVISFQLTPPNALNASPLTESEYKFNEVGTYTLAILYNEQILTNRNITVVPNVLLNTEKIRVTSATTYSNLFDGETKISFKKYKTEDDDAAPIVYGKLPDESNPDKSTIPMYGKTDEQGEFIYQEVLGADAGTNTIANISFSVPKGSAAENNLLSFNGNALTVGWFNTIGVARTGTIVVNYMDDNNNIQIGTVNVEITNKYKAKEDSDIPENTNLMVQTQIACPGIALESNETNDFVIDSIEISVSDTNNNSTITSDLIGVIKDVNTNIWNFTINTHLSQKLLNQTMEIIFRGGTASGASPSFTDVELHYTINNVNIIPYLPSLVDNKKAFSGTEFDFLKDVFNEIDGEKIKSIRISQIDEGTLKEATVGSLGIYSNTAEDYGAKATLAEIVGESKTVNVTYRIEYVSGVVYNYLHTLTILNRQKLTLNVPFKDESSTFIIPSSATFTTLTDDEFAAAGQISEPVLINQTITFGFDEKYSLYRAFVTDAQSNIQAEAVKEVKLVGYQSKSSAYDYYASDSIEITGNEVTFNYHSTFSTGAYAYFVFKITTESGAFGFYYVYLYNQLGSSDFDNVSLENGSANYQANVSTATEFNFLTQNNGNTTHVLGVEVQDLLRIYANNATSASIPTGTNQGKVYYYILSADSNDGSSLFELTFDSTDEDGNPIQVPYITKGQKIDETTKLPRLNNYATIKIAKVYVNSTTKFCFGVDSFFLKPAVEPELLSADFNLTNYGAGDGIATGHYAAELSDTKVCSVPFTVDGTTLTVAEIIDREGNIVESVNDGKGEIIVSVNNNSTDANFGKLTFEQMVTEDLPFVVKYTFNNSLVLFVHYTYKAISVNTDDAVASIGEFSEETGFNNKYYLTWIGKPDAVDNDPTAYNGILKLSINNNTAVTLTYANEGQSILTDGNGNTIISYHKDETPGSATNGFYYLEFVQTTKAIEYRLTFTYASVKDSIGNSPTKMVTAKVASGLHITWAGAKGKSESTPYDEYSTAEEISFASEIGSTLTFETGGNRTDGNDYNDNYYKYKIGHLTLCSTTELDELKLDVEWESDYVLSSNGEKQTTISYPAEGEANPNLTFAHSALTSNVVKLKLTPMAGENAFLTKVNGQDVGVEIEFYVQVKQTYQSLKAVYYVVNSPYENVKQNDTFNLSQFFVFNEAGQAVTDVSDNDIVVINPYRVAVVDMAGSTVLSSDRFNPAEMGLMPENNTNNPNKIYWSLGEGIIEAEKDVTLQFMPVDINTKTTVVLHNSAGVECEYKFQILAQAEPLTFANGVIGGMKEGGNYYATKVVTDPASETEFIACDYDAEKNPKPFAIAQLYDANTSNAYITNITLNKAGTGISETVNKVKENVPPNNGVPGAVLYTISQKQSDGINLILHLYIYENGEIKAELIRNAGYFLFDQLKYTFTLHCNNGEEPMLNNFELIFYNYQIEVKYSEDNATQDVIYAGNSIKLSSKTSVTSNNGNNAVNAETSLVSGTYVLNGISTEINADNMESNNLFVYSSETGILQTNAVAYDAVLTLNFEITQNGYKIATLTYHALILVNYNFKVNGESLMAGDNSSVTNYLLTAGNLNRGNFPHRDNLDEETNGVVMPDTTGPYVGYYTNLSLGLYDATGTVKKTFSESVFTVNSDNENVQIAYPDDENGEENKVHLVFTNDYTGPVQLTLSVQTEGNGTYTVYWNLNVVGFITLKYSSEITGENTIQTNSGEGYTSNYEVYLIAPSSTTGLGAIGISTSNQMPNVLTSGIVSYLGYVVSETPATAQIDAVTAFNNGEANGKAISVVDKLFDVAGRALKHKLPLVAQSMGPNYINYFVTYKIELSYLGQTQTLYATYLVHNPAASVSVHKSLYNTSELSGSNLNLFYFKETFTVNSTPYSIVYTGNNNYTLYVGNSTSGIQGNGETFGSYKFDRTNGYSVYDGVWHTSVAHSVEAYSETKKSMFSANYLDVISFANFINQLKNVKLSDMSEGNATGKSEVEYAFKPLGNGNWGVNLSDGLAGGKLFNNNLSAKLSIVSSSGTTILSNDNFEITANNALTATGKTYKLSQIFQSGEWHTNISTNYEIIGFGASAQSGWVNGASSVTTNANFEKSITYGTKTYIVKEATYSASGGGSFFTTSKNFYYITENVIALDFSNSPESYYFYVTEMQADGSMSIDLGSCLKKYSGGGNISCANVTPDITEIVEDGQLSISTINNNNSATVAVVVYANELERAADEGQTTLSINFTATGEGISINFRIVFSLKNVLVASNAVQEVTTADGVTHSIIGRLENETDADVIMSLVKFVNGYALTSEDGTFAFSTDELGSVNIDGVAYYVKNVTYTPNKTGSAARTFKVLVKNPA